MSRGKSAFYVLLVACACLVAALPTRAAEEAKRDPTFQLQNGDVVAFIGGESTVLEGERGHLETLLSAAFASSKPKFRNLAWEGDTVFEQPRDLNFPDTFAQLKRVGATVIICRFGQQESLKGAGGLEAFTKAYQALCDQLEKQTKRIVLITPRLFEKPRDPLLPDLSKHNDDVKKYADAIAQLARERGYACAHLSAAPGKSDRATENGLQATPLASGIEAAQIARALGAAVPTESPDDTGRWSSSALESLRQEVIVKNQFWFDYWRPMNWAFLGGNRSNVPSSFDHRDPKVRWFPAEMEKFVPLIEKSEERIAALAPAAQGGK